MLYETMTVTTTFVLPTDLLILLYAASGLVFGMYVLGMMRVHKTPAEPIMVFLMTFILSLVWMPVTLLYIYTELGKRLYKRINGDEQ